MKYTVIVRPEAEVDIEKAFNWYEYQESGLGHRFRAEIDRVMTLIGRQPLSFPDAYRGLRRAVAHKFLIRSLHRRGAPDCDPRMRSPQTSSASLDVQAMIKSQLRAIYVEKRKGLSPSEHSDLSGGIVENLFREIDLARVRNLHCFISMHHLGEVETRAIFKRLWREFPDIVTFAPRVNDRAREIESVRFSPATILKQSSWKIPEPADGEIVEPEVLDLVIVPLLCFDERGHRVGYGKGYYDRFLQKCRPDCIRAGLSFFPPVEMIEDTHEDDALLDLCITPNETYRWNRII